MHPTDQDRVDSLDARQRMIDVAERLFADQGIEAVSMRTITLEAGQRNNSAVTYHFGSRAGLVQAILDHRSGPIDSRRRELIDALEEAGSAVTVEDTVRIFVQPLAETLRPGAPGWYLRFLADATADPARAELGRGSEPDGIRWVNRHLARLCDSPPAVLERRLRWMVVITLRVLADHERAAASGARSDSDVVADDLVTTLSALLAAP